MFARYRTTAPKPAPVTGVPLPGSPAAAIANRRSGGTSALRPSRPMRALAGGLLAVTAVVSALAVYTGVGDRVEVLAVGRTVLAGERITAGDLRTVSVATDGGFTAVAASERAQVVGQYARVRLVAGSPIVDEALQPFPVTAPDRAVLSIEIPAGEVPIGLRERSRLVLVVHPRRTGGLATTTPVPIEATVAAVPRNLADLAGRAGASATVALSLEVAPERVATVGSAESFTVGVVDPSAPAGFALGPEAVNG